MNATIQYDLEIPDRKKNVKNKYQLIIEEFLATEHKRVIYEFEDGKEAEKYYQALYRNTYRYGVRVKKRNLKVYLERI